MAELRLQILTALHNGRLRPGPSVGLSKFYFGLLCMLLVPATNLSAFCSHIGLLELIFASSKNRALSKPVPYGPGLPS